MGPWHNGVALGAAQLPLDRLAVRVDQQLPDLQAHDLSTIVYCWGKLGFLPPSDTLLPHCVDRFVLKLTDACAQSIVNFAWALATRIETVGLNRGVGQVEH